MGGSGGSYPGGAAIIREITILFLRGIFCKITSYDDQLPAAFQLVMIFDGDGIGAGSGGALYQGQIDGLVADKAAGPRAGRPRGTLFPVRTPGIAAPGRKGGLPRTGSRAVM